MEDRTRLLVFDNCEHLVDAAAEMIEKILPQSATVAILATSREGLRLPDEQLVPVPSLDVDSSAAMLFVDRASAVGATISSSDDSHAVAEICRRLDGIPLAIELAASRMQSMTATEVRDRLDDRFRLLIGSRRGLERHQTLRHAVQWSYRPPRRRREESAGPNFGLRRRIRSVGRSCGRGHRRRVRNARLARRPGT